MNKIASASNTRSNFVRKLSENIGMITAARKLSQYESQLYT